MSPLKACQRFPASESALAAAAVRSSTYPHSPSLSGGTVLGLVSDCMGKRAPAVTASLVLAMGALVGYSREFYLNL